MTSTKAAIDRLYGERTDERRPIRPFVGGAYEADAAPALRVMVVGINAYVSDEHWRANAHCGDRSFAHWFEHRSHRYEKSARDQTERLAAALAGSTLHPGLAFEGLHSLYSTNAVKRYLHEDLGKKDSVRLDALIDEDLPIWQAELAELARRDRLPHVVVVLGRRFWGRAWRTFRDLPGVLGEVDSLGGLRAHESSTGPSRHYANRFLIGGRSLLLLGLHHPGRGGTASSLDRLLAAEDFRWLAGLSRVRPSCVQVHRAGADDLDLSAF